MSSRTEEFKSLVSKLTSAPPQKLTSRLPRPLDPWTSEAKQTLHSLKTLESFLNSIRPAYVSPPPRSSQREKNKAEGFETLEKKRYLTDRERDEIDVGVKIGMKKAMESVRELEAIEKGR
jgi:syntaxin 18